jgi:CheY-like chemotaxis protein
MDNHSNNEITKKTIMICDDESDVLISFELLLQLKYDIIMVASGEKCVEDYKLHGIMGDSVARKLKEYSETKIILISAYNIDDVLVKELEENKYISKYILKPIETEHLTNLIDELLKN